MLTATYRPNLRLVAALAVVATALLVAHPGFGQHWKPLLSDQGNKFSASFFFDEHSGFVAGYGDFGIYRTTDGGVSWQNSPLTPVPQPVPGGRIIITDIRMENRMHGWVSLEIQLPSFSGLYETTDGGISWHPTSYEGYGACITKSPTALIISNRGPSRGPGKAGGAVSLDNGKTFTNLAILDSTVGMAFCDDVHGVVSGFWDTTWCRTTDGGATWFKMYGGYSKEAWSIYAVPNTSTFFSAAENGWDWDHNIKTYSVIWRSTDYGANWKPFSNLGSLSLGKPIETTGHIAGVSDVALYVQHCWRDGVGSNGFLRSTNKGYTWVDVGGPTNDHDTRFSVLGCRGEVVIAFDHSGNVWKTVDGGDGAFAQSSLSSNTTLTVDPIDLCSPRDTMVSIQNLGCDTIYITDAQAPAMPPLTVLDPSGGAAQFPYRILPGEWGRLKLRLSSLFAGVYQTRLIIELRREGVFSYDTVYVNSTTRFSNPIVADAKTLNFDATNLCDSRDSAIVLSNDSCFTVQIDSCWIKGGQSFLIATPFHNDSIPSGTKKNVVVRFNPKQPGAANDSLIVNLHVLGRPVRLAFAVSGSGLQDNPRFVMLLSYARTQNDSIDFGTRTICQNDSLIPFLITNPGCTSINVSLQLLDSVKKGTPPNDIFQWLVPNGTFKVHQKTDPKNWGANDRDTIIGGIRASARRKGSYRGYLRVVHWFDNSKIDTTDVPFQVTFVQGSKVLSLDASTRDLDTLTFCSTADIPIPIENIGCDTLFFDSLSISGSGFSLVNKPTVPFRLYDSSNASGSRGQLLIHFAPTQAGLSTGVLTIRSDADSLPLRTINFRAFATPTDTVRLGALAARLSVRPGDTTFVSITPSTTFHGKNISQVDMTLEYNGDVMEALGSAAPGAKNVIATSGPESHTIGTTVQYPMQLVGPNIQLDSAVPLVSQAFHFVLSDTLLTNFKIVKLTFNKGDPVFAKCTLGEMIDSGSIDLTLTCGDGVLYRLMHDGENFRIDEGITSSPRKVHPNPVSSGTLAIPYQALRSADLLLCVTNETGQQVLVQNSSVKEAGESSIEFATASLPSGVYHYMLRPTDGGLGRVFGEFVVMK